MSVKLLAAVLILIVVVVAVNAMLSTQPNLTVIQGGKTAEKKGA